MARSHAAIPRIIIVIEPPNESLPNVISPLQSKHPPGRIGGRFWPARGRKSGQSPAVAIEL